MSSFSVAYNVAPIAGDNNAGSGANAGWYGSVACSSSNTTNTLPIRVVDVVPDTALGSADASATTYFEFLVKFNLHQYNNIEGV